MKSVLHDKKRGTCYLCERLRDDYSRKAVLEEHHIFGGNPNRRKSEKHGLKVYLCPEHHRESTEAVHRPDKNGYQKLLQKIAQRKFEEQHSRQEFIETFGRSYL